MAKIRVHSIADQDRTAGWIKQNHPDVFYLYSEKLYRGVWASGDQDIVSPAWVKENLVGHGPLGDADIYPPNAAGKKGVKEGDYLVRIQVEGAESPLEIGMANQYNAPQVTIP